MYTTITGIEKTGTHRGEGGGGAGAPLAPGARDTQGQARGTPRDPRGRDRLRARPSSYAWGASPVL